MALPFTPYAFFEVFAGYNEALWPALVVLWLAAAGALALVVRAPGERADRVANGVLAILWLWGGLAYHAAYFTSINPAAWGFAGLFVVEAVLLIWLGLVRRRVAFGTAQGLARGLGIGLAGYALAYPVLSVLTGHEYPAVPTFGVPCPTGILTAGLLVTSAARPPIAVIIVPIVWAVIGGSAAIVLGVPADVVLLACALILPASTAAKPRLRPSFQ